MSLQDATSDHIVGISVQALFTCACGAVCKRLATAPATVFPDGRIHIVGPAVLGADATCNGCLAEAKAKRKPGKRAQQNARSRWLEEAKPGKAKLSGDPDAG